MANIVSIDYVLKVATVHQCKCWKIWNSEGELLDKRESATVNQEQSLQALRESFNDIEGDFATIRISPKVSTKGGDNKTDTFLFKVRCLKQSAPIVSEQLTSYTGKGDAGIYAMISDLKVQIAEQKKDSEIQALQRQIAELKNGKGKNRMLEQYLTKILLQSDPAPAAPAIAGVTEQQPIEKKPAPAAAPAGDQRAELVAALNKIKAVDPAGYIETLSKLAKFAESNPDAYNSYKSML